MSVNRSIVLLAFAGAAAIAAPAVAHHSGAMFDRTHTITIDGTFMSQEYTNPHVWISVMGKPTGTKVKASRWDIETVSVQNLTKIGINKETLKPGDKLKVKNPLPTLATRPPGLFGRSTPGSPPRDRCAISPMPGARCPHPLRRPSGRPCRRSGPGVSR